MLTEDGAESAGVAVVSLYIVRMLANDANQARGMDAGR